MTKLLICAAMAAALLACSTTAQSAPPSNAMSAYARPGQLVKLPGGLRINLRCAGTGVPTIVLTAGAGEQSLTWHALQAHLAQTHRVCSWDRPGFGFSDPSGAPMDVSHLTDSLEAALKAGRVRPPYLLVGHSLGSFETLMLAFRHPHDVAGIVLIDPAGPHQDARFKKAAPASYALIDAAQTQQTADLRRCITIAPSPSAVAGPSCVMKPIPGYPDDLNRALIRMDREIARKKDSLALLVTMYSGVDSRELSAAWWPLGTIPLIVLTAGNPPSIPLTAAAKGDLGAFVAEWSAIHDDIAHLSTRGINRRIAGSGHYIYEDRPAVVFDAIEGVARAITSRQTTSKR